MRKCITTMLLFVQIFLNLYIIIQLLDIVNDLRSDNDCLEDDIDNNMID